MLNYVRRSSEYATNYTGQRPPSRVMAIPRIYSTGAERTTTVSNETLARSNPIYDGDSMEIDHLSSIRRNETVPRSYFYRGQQAASSMRESLPSLSVAENSNSSGENLIRIWAFFSIFHSDCDRFSSIFNESEKETERAFIYVFIFVSPSSNIVFYIDFVRCLAKIHQTKSMTLIKVFVFFFFV